MGTKIQRRKGGLAFYELPNSVRSSAEIISEARIEMAGKRSGMVAMAPGGIRAVDTKRPFTPRESQRTLFGRAGRVGVSRPPSAVSLKYLQTERIDGEAIKPVPWLITKPPRPVQQAFVKRSETMKLPLPSMCLSLNNPNRVKLPDLTKPAKQDVKSSRLIRLQFHAASLVNLPEEDEEKLNFETPDASKILCKTHSFDGNVHKKHTKSSEQKIQTDGDDKSDAATKFKQTSLTDACKSEKILVNDINSQESDVVLVHNSLQDSTIKTSITSSNDASRGSLCEQDSFSTTDNSQESCVSQVAVRKETLKSISCERESELRSCYLDPILQLTQRLNSESANENNESKVIALLQNLYEMLDSKNLLGTKLNSKNKALILRSLYKFVERSSNELLLEVAHIILALNVAGNNLAGVCKLIFKVSRSDKNDDLFQQGNILELFINALGTAEPMEDAEACVYGYGALKFLLMNSALLRKLLSFGALELMVLHMKVINKWKMDGGVISEQTSHALFQLTGALRNVAGEEEEPFPEAFVTSGVINELCSTIYLFSCDLDIVSNVSRTLSILSTHDICCSAIMDHECSIKTMVKLLKKFPGRQDIVVRLCYVLGNIMAKSDKARLKFYYEEDSLLCLIELLFKYMKINSTVSSHASGNTDLKPPATTSSNLVVDVLIKVVRVVANMSISPVVGMSIVGHNKEESNDETCGKILDALLAMLRNHTVENSPELVVSILATLNNLTFWAVGVENEDFSQRQIEMAEVLHCFIMEDHKETLAEAIRVFGNLTQSKAVREYTVENGILEKLLHLLHKPLDFSKDILMANVGILVNMMADPDKRRIFANHQGISRLMHILENTNGRNWNLSSLICQVIWNYIIESQDLYIDLGKNETDKLVNILVDYLDEEHYFGIPEGSEVDPEISMTTAYQEWEEFAAVATDLLEKIEAFMDSSRINTVFIEENDPYQSR
ncbi:armadillo repeat-containing protein 2 [Hetaerina americana]|uniref:armadillo repeat-containing protein 2 n=1 Tax=Hetaerina americana TaxID=62018 RepID=UPI003A7F2996